MSFNSDTQNIKGVHFMDYLKEFCTKLQNLDRSKNIATVFKDFLTLCTCSFAQPFYRSEEIEQKYLKTINEYTKEQAEEFPKLLAFLIEALEEKHQDFLGQVYMNFKLGNTANGQFFTPYHLSRLMAEINFAENENFIKDNEFITLSEPCCGSGGMIIAFAETMKNHNYNYQKQLFVEAVDIDEMAFMMCYIQLSLFGIPARVILGDTLSMNYTKILYTPFYFLGRFDSKLKQLQKKEIKPVKVEIKQLQLSFKM